MTNVEKTLTTKRTKRRTPVSGGRNVLTVQGKEPGFEYRIVNDVGDRPAMFAENGWEFVNDTSIQIGERRINNPTAKGTVVSASVGQGVQGVLMRIPKEFYEEDQAAKAAHIDKQEQDIKNRAKQEGFYGKLSINS
jgi:hypothetical protein